MSRLASAIIIVGYFAFAGAIARAQQPPAAGAGQRGAGPQAPPPMTNLQVFPKDTPRPQVVQTMQAFAQGLGVRCAYCHVDEGPGKEDYASDEKNTKKVARQMMVLARDINEKLPSAVGKSTDATTRVGCATCHRGVAIPKLLADIMTETAAASGAQAAIAKYRELRKQDSGGQSYDFSEGGLLPVAQRLTAANQPDDALAFLQLNTEFYPQSARTYVVMAQANARKNDSAAAIKNLEKALEIDPDNAQARRQLDQLKSTGK